MKVRMLNGWPLLGLVTLVLLAIAGICLASHAFDVAGVRLAIRATARSSLVLFALAFSAQAMLTLWPSELTRWQRRNRRQLGLGFAVSHAIHAAVIVAFARMEPVAFHEQVMPGTLVSGGFAYVFIAAMAATSFDRTAALIGPRAWRALHWIGGYYIWVSFIFTNGKRIGQSPLYALPVVLMLAILAIRIAAKRRNRAVSAVA
ncbi:MAG: hypothetical protein JOY81_05330 [Alphaproteobacteria bacterium]|nr:hypothetical protein [Alphaproteobacteria bacterium]